MKQRKYPVLQLTRNAPKDDNRDERMENLMTSLYWASACDLEGVNSYGSWVLNGGNELVTYIRDKLNLVLYAWEGPLTVSEINRLIDYDLDGLCYDLIDLKIGSTKKRRRGPSNDENEDETNEVDHVTFANRQNVIAPLGSSLTSVNGSTNILLQRESSSHLYTKRPVKVSSNSNRLA